MKTNEGTTLTTDTHDIDEQTKQSNLRTSLAFIRTIDAEKRTHLAELRTGIGILTIPMSLLTILIATSNYYSIDQVLSLITGLVIGIVILLIIGSYLVITSFRRLRGDNRLRASCDNLSYLVAEFNNNDH
ncbi:MAG: hypothetical protein ACFFEA_11110 [Candidatus Thorarchaeota archaeon]